MVNCPEVLGEGVRTKRQYCDVLTGRDPAGGIMVTLPPHAGPVTLTFDLHNRHTYSEEEVRAKRGYRRYTATIGVLTLDNTLVSRAIVQNEFRTQADLLDRISETGKLEEADEEELGKAIADFVDDFGPDFDEHGDPFEAGESDRVKSEEERSKPSRAVETEETEKEATPA